MTEIARSRVELDGQKAQAELKEHLDGYVPIEGTE
jgi:hypothetical protein